MLAAPSHCQLMYGLFGGFWQAMITLGDSLEPGGQDLHLGNPVTCPGSEFTVGNIAYDGIIQLQDIQTRIPPHPGCSAQRSSILGYVHRLYMTGVDEILHEVSHISEFLLCAAH